MTDDGNADVSIRPETSTSAAADLGVPGRELSESDTIRIGDVLTRVTRFDEVEGVAVVDHSRLNGSWSSDPIARLRGRWC